jgi:hypothetical protein
METDKRQIATEMADLNQPPTKCYQLMYACTVLIRLLVNADAENPLVLPDLDRGCDASAGLSESGSG